MRRASILLLISLMASRSRAQELTGRVLERGIPVVNAAVYLVGVDEPAPLARDTAIIDQRHLRFSPRVLVVPPGSSVAFVNSDSVLHNVFSPGGATPPFDLGTYPIGERRTRVFVDAGVSVILCHVHPEMVAYIVTAPTRHYAVTDSTGRFRISGAAAGTYRVHVAHRRRMLDLQSVTLNATDTRQLDLTLDGVERRPR